VSRSIFSLLSWFVFSTFDSIHLISDRHNSHSSVFKLTTVNLKIYVFILDVKHIKDTDNLNGHVLRHFLGQYEVDF